jgi:hypothetical protein
MTEPIVPPRPCDILLFRNEWSVLLECAAPWHDRQRMAELLRSADWARLLILAEAHGVAGHLAAGLRDLEKNLVPLEIRQTLVDRQRAQIFLSMRLTAELFRILDLFTTEGIDALIIKGPALAARAYADSATRSYGDLDLLVRQRDIRRATELMSALGFAPAVPLTAIDAGKIPGQYLFSKADSQLIVELHNDRTLRYFPRRLPLEDCFARQVRVRLDVHEAPALSVEDELVLICVHGAKHLWERLMWIADVAGLVTRQPGIDWERVTDLTKAVGAERMLRVGLLLAADLLKAQLPENVRAIVRADVSTARLAHQVCQWLPAAGYAPPNLFQRAFFRLHMHGGLLTAPAYLLRLLLSPTEEDWKIGADAEGKRGGFLQAVRRPLRLARKYGRGSKA